MDKKISILGSGGFGLALAHLLAQRGRVDTWEYDEKRWLFLQQNGKSDLIQYRLHKNINVSHDIVETVKDASFIFIAIPSQFVVSTVMAIKRHFGRDTTLIIGSKGLDVATNSLLFEVLQHKITQKVFILSGPMFAAEIVKDIPVVGMLAGKDKKKMEKIVALFHDTHLKLETTDDMTGVSLAGAIKNVYAIGSGILKGLGYESSTNAHYLSHAFKELEHIIVSYKGSRETLLSPAGFGDLLLTCTSNRSRNFKFGEVVGKGISPKNISVTIEGKQTLLVLTAMLKQKKVQAPLLTGLYEIIYKNRDPDHLMDIIR